MVVLLPRLGLIGAGYALLAGAVTATVVSYCMVLWDLKLAAFILARTLWRPVVGAVAMTATVHYAHPYKFNESTFGGQLTNFLMLGGMAALSYFITVGLCWLSVRKPDGAEALIVRFGLGNIGKSA